MLLLLKKKTNQQMGENVYECTSLEEALSSQVKKGFIVIWTLYRWDSTFPVKDHGATEVVSSK